MLNLRMLLIDTNTVFLDQALKWLGNERRISVVGWTKSWKRAIGLMRTSHPDVVLVDVSVPDLHGGDAITAFTRRTQSPQVIVMLSYDKPEYRDWARAVGAIGCISKSDFILELKPLIRTLFLKRA
jgi:DNA-binding NarL/FixJ family response regulator